MVRVKFADRSELFRRPKYKYDKKNFKIFRH